MASLVGIAPELAGLICSNLSTGDILSLCRSCQGLYTVAHPLLFRHITIAWNRSASPNKPPDVTGLLLLILRHPSYAAYIKTVDIPHLHYDDCNYHVWHIGNEGNPSPLSREDTALVRAAIEQCCLPDASEHDSPDAGEHDSSDADEHDSQDDDEIDFPDDDEDYIPPYFPDAKGWESGVVEHVNLAAIIALILVHCTHLQSLTVNADFVPPHNKWFPHVIRVALSATEGASRPSSFHQLTNLTWGSTSELSHFYEPDFPLSTELLLLSFSLPSVTTLSFNAAPRRVRMELQLDSSGHDGLKWPLGDPPLATSLTTLRLDFYSSVSAEYIEPLLRQAPNLQSLVCNCSLELSSSPFDLPALRQGLDQVRGTLSHLVVRFQILMGEGISVSWDGLGPLCSLTVVEDLEISLAALFGPFTQGRLPRLAGFLPCGLKRLVISDHTIVSDPEDEEGEDEEGLSRGHAREPWRLPWRDIDDYEWPGRRGSDLLMTFFAGACKTATPLLEEFVLNVRDNGGLSHEYWADDGHRGELRQLVESQGIKCSINLD